MDSFGISFKHDIVGTTNAGDPVMMKYSRQCQAESQIFTNHTSNFSSEGEDSIAEESAEDNKNDNSEYYIEKANEIKSNLEMVPKIVIFPAYLH